MLRFTAALCFGALVGASVLATASARADERPADAIVKDIDAVVMPAFDASKRGDQEAVQKYLATRQKALSQKSELIGELLRADPSNGRLADLLPQRWALMPMQGSSGLKSLAAETEQVMARTQDKTLKGVAAYWQVMAAVQGDASAGATRKLIEQFLAIAPKDERTAQMLMSLVFRLSSPEKADTQRLLLETLVKDFPDSRQGAMARGSLRRLDGVGKPFALEFTEAVGGSEISMKGLKGKVVVLDFWATWCGPCVAEMPKMKSLYAEYKDKGVEFIGVSLDQKEGGLEKLKAFVKDKEIPWPQYYQGDGWESKFSSSWGINSIPAVFVVDQEGKLHSVEARGKLETILPELLAKPGAKPAAGGGQ